MLLGKIGIIALKLWGYALGTVVVHWGMLLLLLAPLLLSLLIVLLTNQIWNRLTGQDTEWKWITSGCENAMQAVDRLHFRWVGWTLGMLIQVWYAGYAASLVQSSILETSTMVAIATHTLGVSGIILAAVVFYGLYTLVVNAQLPVWSYLLMVGASLGAYAFLSYQPRLAAILSESWQQMFAAALSEMAESLFESL